MRPPERAPRPRGRVQMECRVSRSVSRSACIVAGGQSNTGLALQGPWSQDEEVRSDERSRAQRKKAGNQMRVDEGGTPMSLALPPDVKPISWAAERLAISTTTAYRLARAVAFWVSSRWEGSGGSAFRGSNKRSTELPWRAGSGPLAIRQERRGRLVVNILSRRPVAYGSSRSPTRRALRSLSTPSPRDLRRTICAGRNPRLTDLAARETCMRPDRHIRGMPRTDINQRYGTGADTVR